MKRLKKFMNILLTAIMVLAMCVPVMATDGTSATYAITITNAPEGHRYEAYQIFKGDLSTDSNGVTTLSNIDWGDGITEAGKQHFANSAAEKAKSLTSSELAASFAKEVAGTEDTPGYLVSSSKKESSYDNNTKEYTISGLLAGYYLVKDASLTSADDYYSAYIMEVVKNTEVQPKGNKPTVDKEVWDELGDAENANVTEWGESADHAINEKFKFKLTATIPADPDFAAYPTYMIKFNDTMSKGVTFDRLLSVKVNNNDIPALSGENGGYTCTATPGLTAGKNDEDVSWSLTVSDVKKQTGVNLTQGATIEVIYEAHLNERATVNNASGSTDNKNGVNLEYSNNPNGNGHGTTATDYVWVFTYRVNNTKYDATDENNKKVLSGAGFRLFDENGANEIQLIYDDSLDAYRPVKDNENSVEMRSNSQGQFNIVGLDAGTYKLKETTTPSGYNKCADVTVIIAANHQENQEGTSATTTLTSESKTNIEVDNKKGSELPSTGGIGTTIFYVVGVILMLGAGVLLVTKKRMSSNR